MVLKSLIVSVFVVFYSNITQAKSFASTCENLKDCIELRKNVDTRINEIINLDEPITYTSGNFGSEYCSNPKQGVVCEMTQKQAEEVCRSRGSRLPTALELSNYSILYGAKGIQKTNFPDVDFNKSEVRMEIQKMIDSGYYPVLKRFSSGIGGSVDFYMNASGYVEPTEAKNFGDFIWTSSLYPFGLGKGDSAFGFHGITGGFFPDDSDNYKIKFAARCVLNP